MASMDTQELLTESARSGQLAAWALAALPAVVTAVWAVLHQTTRGPSLAPLLMGAARALIY
jgi:hypothetical protein